MENGDQLMLPSDAPDLVSLFGHAALRRNLPPALRVGGFAAGSDWSYPRLFAAAEGLANELRRRGLGRGDRVGFLVGSSAEFVVACLATLACGAAMVPINLAYKRREIAQILLDAEPRLMIVGRAQRAALEEFEPGEMGGAEAILVAEELLAGLERETKASSTGCALEPLVELDRDDLALLIYTSGTTGRSKGAMLSHGNVLAMIASLHEAWRWRADDALLLTLPLFHMHGLVNGLHCALAAGATLQLETSFDARRVLDRLEGGETTLFFGVPTLYVRLVGELRRRGGRHAFPGVRLFVSGSAPLAAETHAAFAEITGHEILERYGMTETGMLTGNPLDGPRRAGTVGLPLPGVELRIADENGTEVAAGGEGEVEVRGPNVFSGYWRVPEKSAASFRVDAAGRRWFRTGDRGRIDPADGYLTLLGRSSELILSGGFNVYPREIEEVLVAFPGVREAAVTGEPHAEFGASPIAFLVVAGELDLDALDAYCRAELAPFKLPRRYQVVDQLPRNALGKVEKHKLVAQGS